jgi:hypothetical protein
VDDPKEFKAAWLRQFEKIRANSASGVPPFHRIEPQDLKINFVAPLVCVATFHLRDDPKVVGRRTFILVQMDGEWLVDSGHASNFALSETP